MYERYRSSSFNTLDTFFNFLDKIAKTYTTQNTSVITRRIGGPYKPHPQQT